MPGVSGAPEKQLLSFGPAGNGPFCCRDTACAGVWPRLRGRVAPPLRRVKGAHETPHKPPLRSGWWRSSWTSLDPSSLRCGFAGSKADDDARRSRWGPRRRARPSSSASSPPRGPRPTRWQPPADGRPSGSVSGMPRPSTARRAGRSTRPGRNSHGRHPHGHAGDGVPLAAFPGDGPRHPRTPARQRAEAPWNPGAAASGP